VQLEAQHASDLRHIETRLLLENDDVDDVTEQLEAMRELQERSRTTVIEALRAQLLELRGPVTQDVIEIRVPAWWDTAVS
jgi:hypothetical protein